MANENTSPATQLLTDSMTIAGASALAYLASFLFEQGYANHFGIPAAFITPSLTTILVAAAAVGGVFFWLVIMSPLYSHLWVASEDSSLAPYRFILRQLAIIVIVGVLVVVIYGWSWLVLVVGLGGLLPLLFSFLAVALTERKKSIREKAAIHADIQANDHGYALFDRLVRMLGPHGSRIMIFCVLVLWVAYGAGSSHAWRQEEFLVHKSDPSMVLLRNYGDLMISARINRVERRVTDELVVDWLGEKKTVEFRLEKIGPLARRASSERAPSAASAASAGSAASVGARESQPL